VGCRVERIGYIERQKIEKHLGSPLPPVGEPLPPEIEIPLSGAIAEGAARATQEDAQRAAMQKRMAEEQDPMIQLQKKQVQIEEFKAQSDAQAKQAKIAADARAKDEREKTERMRIGAQSTANEEKADIQAAQSDREDDVANADIALKQAQIAKLIAEIEQLKKEPSGIRQNSD
jgi:hypothetical protein